MESDHVETPAPHLGAVSRGRGNETRPSCCSFPLVFVDSKQGTAKPTRSQTRPPRPGLQRPPRGCNLGTQSHAQGHVRTFQNIFGILLQRQVLL